MHVLVLQLLWPFLIKYIYCIYSTLIRESKLFCLVAISSCSGKREWISCFTPSRVQHIYVFLPILSFVEIDYKQKHHTYILTSSLLY
jgi:hypothetical protein